MPIILHRVAHLILLDCILSMLSLTPSQAQHTRNNQALSKTNLVNADYIITSAPINWPPKQTAE